VNCPDRWYEGAGGRSTIRGVTEEEAARILGPFLARILSGPPTPPSTVGQIEVLLRLLTGHGPDPASTPLFWPV
jgi:hypothetical protein